MKIASDIFKKGEMCGGENSGVHHHSEFYVGETLKFGQELLRNFREMLQFREPRSTSYVYFENYKKISQD